MRTKTRRMAEAEKKLDVLEQRIQRLEAEQQERHENAQSGSTPKLYEVGTLLHPESD